MSKNNKGYKILVVVSDFYKEISDIMVSSAVNVLENAGFSYDIVKVPGAFEIPSAIVFAILGNSEEYLGYIALGCVIKGETDHYYYVCGNVVRLIGDIAVQHAVPIGMGVITAQNFELAIERAKTKDEGGVDSAGHAASAVLRMLKIYDRYILDEDGCDGGN